MLTIVKIQCWVAKTVWHWQRIPGRSTGPQQKHSREFDWRQTTCITNRTRQTTAAL